jgi:hypothetical protein
MARGGYRKPNNPAPVSGPGALSRRTDGGAGSKQAMKEIRTGKYGESKALMEQQQGAPMAGNPAPSPRMAAPPVTSLMEPTQRPDEPVTQGMPFGAGSSTNPVPSNNANTSVVQKYLPALETLAASEDANDIFRSFVRAVKANVEMGRVQ